jgi:hypothetical protein
VLIHNGTSATARVREVAIHSGADIVTTLSPGGQRESLWRFNSGDRITVRVENESGALLFCHAYSFQDLDLQKRTVEIIEGRNDCPK